MSILKTITFLTSIEKLPCSPIQELDILAMFLEVIDE